MAGNLRPVFYRILSFDFPVCSVDAGSVERTPWIMLPSNRQLASWQVGKFLWQRLVETCFGPANRGLSRAHLQGAAKIMVFSPMAVIINRDTQPAPADERMTLAFPGTGGTITGAVFPGRGRGLDAAAGLPLIRGERLPPAPPARTVPDGRRVPA